jgi:heterotetrameric sarcosine oxidase gamma subunit
VAVFDQTSFSKYLVTGPDAEAALQWLCTNDVAVPPGAVVYTGLLNERGTYESDLTVTRLSAAEFLLVASAATAVRDVDHLRRHLPPGARAAVVDVTSGYAVYGVMGPRSRELLSRLTRRDLSDAAFGFGTSAMIDLGYATVRATRITYVGELGWELYVPAEFAAGVYEDLFAAGADLGVVNAGYYAIESLRLEKGYRAFGRELTPDYNPVEAGLLFACKLGGTTDFLGRAALEQARAAGPRRRLVSLVLADTVSAEPGSAEPGSAEPGSAELGSADPGALMWGSELVLRDGRPAGQVTSAAWGETLGAAVGLAYVSDPAGAPVTRDFLETGSYTVNVAGQLVPARVSLRPPYDPSGRRVR